MEKSRYFQRDVTVAIKYGFRGFSKGGVNGILRVTGRDKALLDWYERFSLSNQYENLAKKYNLNPEETCPVKIVSHKPHGKRIVGLMDKSTNFIVFVDEVPYKQ